jgi:hypothetical protein
MYSGSEQLGVVQLQVTFSSGNPSAVILYSASAKQRRQERIFSFINGSNVLIFYSLNYVPINVNE